MPAPLAQADTAGRSHGALLAIPRFRDFAECTAPDDDPCKDQELTELPETDGHQETIRRLGRILPAVSGAWRLMLTSPEAPIQSEVTSPTSLRG